MKVAHARYVVEKLSAKRPAVIYQSTAYGQSGREQLNKTLTELKAPPVLEESIAPTVNDLSPALLRAKNVNADVIVLHLHAASTVLAVRQARQFSCPTCRSLPARPCTSPRRRRCSSPGS